MPFVSMSKRELQLYTNGLTLEIKLAEAQKELEKQEREYQDKWKAKQYDNHKKSSEQRNISARYISKYFS